MPDSARPSVCVVQAMSRLVDKGYTTFDLADHYGPAEDFVGAFETQQREQAVRGQVCTMLVLIGLLAGCVVEWLIDGYSGLLVR